MKCGYLFHAFSCRISDYTCIWHIQTFQNIFYVLNTKWNCYATHFGCKTKHSERKKKTYTYMNESQYQRWSNWKIHKFQRKCHTMPRQLVCKNCNFTRPSLNRTIFTVDNYIHLNSFLSKNGNSCIRAKTFGGGSESETQRENEGQKINYNEKIKCKRVANTSKHVDTRS